ncbi:MAG: hypothetical protein ACU826_04295 [Gammaproteobacteria bacterium]
MKVVYYAIDAPWVGKMKCPSCKRLTPVWRSSGMSENFPHFYCDTCSNAIHREADKALVYRSETSPDLLETIAASLPQCPCGGRFKPGANPKCPHCRAEYVHRSAPVKRLEDPNLILLDGACLIRDRLYPYQVSIGSKPKYWLRMLKNMLAEKLFLLVKRQ